MPQDLRTRVGIVGAGPAGLILGQLLQNAGIASVIVEARSQAHIEQRIRAGVLEQGTVDLLNAAGAGDRMRREGLVHHGIELRFNGQRHRIDLHERSGGRSITVYGQQEVVKDLIALRRDPIYFEAANVRIDGLTTETPRILFNDGDAAITCDFIAGCDGFHGVCRPSIPASAIHIHEKTYPFGWLGILAATPPPSQELIYAHHERGFALLSMRNLQTTRAYVQCSPNEDLGQWPDARLWDELQHRLDTTFQPGDILQKGVTAMRSFVADPMQYGRLFLAGDAAHIVPPTGAKGMNLAAADVVVLARALESWYRNGNREPLDHYSQTCLRRIWRVQHFSWWMTSLLHRYPGDGTFELQRQLAELDQVATSRSAATTLAENYTGLPFP
jgi:p-hydroxybenzoate 3-monooxygenase